MDDRPWSDIEIRMAMQSVHERLDDEIATLKSLGIAKAHATNERQVQEGRQMLVAKQEHRNTLTSDALRQAWVRSNTPVGDLMLQEDLAATIYWDQKELVVTLRQDMSMLQSMLRNAEDQVASMGGGRSRQEPSHQRR